MGKLLHPEQIRLLFDHTKHVTTLSGGSIVVIVTFYEKLGGARAWKWLIAASLISFVTSIISGLYAQVSTISVYDIEEHEGDKETAYALLVCWVSFALAMLALCVYGVRNL